jgi:hypothetical protein
MIHVTTIQSRKQGVRQNKTGIVQPMMPQGEQHGHKKY